MQARTPQKKKSLELQHKIQLTNNSCVLNNSTIIQSNNGLTNDGNEQILNNLSSIASSSSGPHQKDQKGTGGQIRNNSIANPNSKVSLVRKYVQQELQSRNKYQNQYAKQKEKQYREVVISDQFIRSHKLYKMLKQQMAIADARHLREANSLKNQLETQNSQIKAVKESNHQLKVELWQYKNQLMELRTMLNQQEQENKKLVQEYEQTCKDQQGEDEQDEQEREEEEQCDMELTGNHKNYEEESNQALDQGRIQNNLTLLSNGQQENMNSREQQYANKFGQSKGFLQNFLSRNTEEIERITNSNFEIQNQLQQNEVAKVQQQQQKEGHKQM